MSEVAIKHTNVNNNNAAEKPTWMNEILVCMRPVLSLLGKNSYSAYNRDEESWEIPFELISGETSDIIVLFDVKTHHTFFMLSLQTLNGLEVELREPSFLANCSMKSSR